MKAVRVVKDIALWFWAEYVYPLWQFLKPERESGPDDAGKPGKEESRDGTRCRS